MAEKKMKIRWKNVILALLALALVIYMLVFLVSKIFSGGKKSDESTASSFTACSLSASKLKKTITSENYEKTYAIGDYVIYGENLAFYTGEYSVGASSGFGKGTLILRDLCTGTEIKMEKPSGDIQGQINLASIPDGFYEVFVEENLIEKRVYMTNSLSGVSVNTATRDGSYKTVSLYADATMFNDKNAEENALDNNYLFVDVRSSAEANTEYDVVLYPGPIVYNGSYYDTTANGIRESTAMYELAVAVKSKLEAKGYKAYIPLASGEFTEFYGDSGTLKKIYNSKAKYMVTFAIYGIDEGQGIDLTYSSYVSSDFAQSIYDSLTADNLTVGLSGDSSVHASRHDDEGYDSDYDIRDTGGKALGAGLDGEVSVEGASFATKKAGLETVFLNLLNAGNAEDVENYLNNTDKFAEAIAQGIINHLTAKAGN